jgi:hypothetical protein
MHIMFFLLCESKYYGMSGETESLFGAFFALEDIRELLRQSAPDHRLGETEKEELKTLISKAKNHLSDLEELL